MTTIENTKSTITLTFGEQAENHKGMQIIGDGLAKDGFHLRHLRAARKKFEEKGYVCEYYRLDKPQREAIKEEHGVDLEQAAILVIRNGVEACAEDDQGGNGVDALFKEQMELKWDTKAKMYGRVVNKHARHNLCYGDESQEADFENGKGTIVAWDTIPLTQKLRNNLEYFFGQKASNLQGEGNLYYDSSKCGISMHGDGERRIVIAARLGKSMPLHYHWYYQGKPIGDSIELEICNNDLYVMSAKAVGTDWKKKNIPTLRHAAGCKKYTTIKK
jgi:hypothetical protein